MKNQVKQERETFIQNEKDIKFFFNNKTDTLISRIENDGKNTYRIHFQRQMDFSKNEFILDTFQGFGFKSEWEPSDLHYRDDTSWFSFEFKEISKNQILKIFEMSKEDFMKYVSENINI